LDIRLLVAPPCLGEVLTKTEALAKADGLFFSLSVFHSFANVTSKSIGKRETVKKGNDSKTSTDDFGMFVQSEKFVEEHGGRVATSRFTGRNGRKSIQRFAMKESRTLAALLPKLLSGELRVPSQKG
jgi:hypothetical protein